MSPEELYVTIDGKNAIRIGGVVLPDDDFSISDFLADEIGMTWLHPGGINSTEQLLALMKIKPEDKVVDMGCGLGSTSRYIAKRYGCEVLGIERDQNMYNGSIEKSGSANPKVSYLLRDAKDTGLDDNSVDSVVIQSVVCFNNKNSIFKEAFRILKPGGQLAINEVTWTKTPNETVEKVTRATVCETFKGALEEKQWTALLESVGLVDIESEVHAFAATAPYQMLREEGLLKTIAIMWRVLSHPELNMRLGAVSNYIRDYPGYFGYGLYIGHKPG